MNIDILASDGSQRLVTSKTIWGDRWQIGVGGAELALLTMCEEWARRGDQVRLYNDPREPNDLFEQLAIKDFDPSDKRRDVLVVFRSPNPKAIASTGKRVWWSCDQYTHGSFQRFAPNMDKVVVISPFHARYFEDTYAIRHTVVSDLPVRVHDYPEARPEKVRNRFLFSSVPDRGLDQLWRIWPLVRAQIPDAHVVITSDYRLWGSAPLNERYRVRWMAHDGFTFLGGVRRERLIQEQLQASVMAYPCVYDELFCIAVAEAQYAGVYPITTNAGALPTTNMGTVVNWDARDRRGDELFVELLVKTVNNPSFPGAVAALQEKAHLRFHPDTILNHWDREVFS